MFTCISSLLTLPPMPALEVFTPRLVLSTKYWAQLPVLHSTFPVATYFTLGSIYMSMLLLLLLLLSRFSHVQLCVTPQTAAHQAPPSLGFSRQEHWSGLPFLSPMHESEKWKWRHSVVFESGTPWTAAYQAPLSMGFSRQEYWSGLPLPSPDHHPDLSLIISHLSRVNKLQLIHNFMSSHDIAHDLV